MKTDNEFVDNRKSLKRFDRFIDCILVIALVAVTLIAFFKTFY